MRAWLRIDEQKPEQEQKVFYWFGSFGKVYEGAYVSEDTDFSNSNGALYQIDYFYDGGGFLGDDVTFWMPREEGDDMPDEPSLEERRSCLYHPETFEEYKERTRSIEDGLIKAGFTMKVQQWKNK